LAVASSYALNCEISLKSSFDRKHYFYADMPQGFQITQHRAPIARNGYVDFLIEGNKMKRLRIEQVQLEQDSGKTLHDPVDNMSLIDLNRAGVGLIEVVTAPDLHSAADAHAFVREMLLILDYAGSCKGRMEEGEFRVDANVSVSRHPDEMGTRTEVKNINRFKGIQKAVDFEIKRQIEVLQSGGKVIQETRSLTNNGETESMRAKESDYDYRFMPEGNLPNLILHTDATVKNSNAKNPINVDAVKSLLPTLPQKIRENLTSKFSLDPYTIDFMLHNKMANYFTSMMEHRSETLDVMLTYDWLRTILLPYLENNSLIMDEGCPLKAVDLAELLELAQTSQIDGGMALKAFAESSKNNFVKTPCQVITERGWSTVTDEATIRMWCAEAVEEVRRDDPKLLQFGEKVLRKEKKLKQQRNRLISKLLFYAGRLSRRGNDHRGDEDGGGGKLHAKMVKQQITEYVMSISSTRRSEQEESKVK